VSAKDLPPSVKGETAETLGSRATAHNLPLQEIERRYIQQVLEAANWNIKKAAGTLRIDRTTLYNKIRKYKLAKPAP
jgi:two-component system response regulator HydG